MNIINVSISKRILGLVDKLDDFAFNLNLPQQGKY